MSEYLYVFKFLYSPVDDARFKSGIPSVLNIAQDNDAVTLGLYDIYFNPARVNLNGGNFASLDTIVERVAHTVQFHKTWAKQPQAIYIGTDLGGYDAAKGAWAADYAYYASKGLYQNGDGCKNDVEKWAKNRKFEAPGKDRSLLDVFNAFVNQPKPHDLLTKTEPSAYRSVSDMIDIRSARLDDFNEESANMNSNKPDDSNSDGDAVNTGEQNYFIPTPTLKVSLSNR